MLKQTFINGRMNLDADERLLQKGEYREAYALEVIHSEDDNAGALEKPLSNKQLTNYDLGSNVYEMGKAMDNYQKKIYWFTLSDTGCRLFEWDDINQVQSVVLEDTRPEASRVFKLKKENLITGVVKIISQDVANDLFMWTDDNDEICCINIERAKTWGTNNFNKEDIYLIKKPPHFAPRVTPTYTADGSNNIEERFLSFAYRYRYRDGEYSALSDYTNYNFYPGQFDLDYFNLENKGMVNSFNAMKIDFNTGDKQVTEIQLVVKQPNSNNLYIVETFSKSKNGWGDFLTRSHVFSNSKIYKVLPEKELYRSYDNVPRKAKALALIENYPVFGNYLEGYNIVNDKNKPINIDYTVALQNNLIEEGEDYTVDVTDSTKLKVTDQEAYDLTTGKKLILTFDMDVDGVSAYTNEFFFILNDDYPTLDAVFNSVDFKTLLEVINQHFRANYTYTEPDGWAITDDTEITYALESGNPTFTVKDIDFEDTNNGNSPEVVSVNFRASSIVAITNTINATSCKTNRNYEVGILYMDEFGRRSTVLTSASNTLYIPQRYSVFQNRLITSLNHEPPYWADRFKMVVKTNPLTYQTLYITKFYTEDLYTWCKLEGNNKDKISEGDILIIKKAGAQVAVEPIKIKVLEIKEQEENFISGNTDQDENEILEEKGWYMRIRPTKEFSMDLNDFKIDSREFGDRGASNDHKPIGYLDLFTKDNGEGLEEKSLPVGSNIQLFINSSRNYKSGWKNITFQEEFYTQRAYDSIGNWFNDILLVDGKKLEGIHDNSDEISDYRPQLELVRGNLITTNGAYAFQEDPSGKLYLKIQGLLEGSASKNGYVRAKIVVRTGSGFYAFETENKLADQETFFETQDCYEVIDGNHAGNIQNQDFETGTPGIIELDFFNCFTQGDGIESYRIKDNLNTNYLNIDLRPSATSVEEYREVRRFADLTYGQPYIESTNINGLNEFNLSTANYKELDKQNGSIQMLIARENDILVMQEEKIGRVSFGKNLLETASGERILTKGDEILGVYQPYAGVLGVGNNPESVDMDGDRVYYVSARNGTPVRLSNDGTTEINYGLTSHFRNLFINNPTSRKIGGWDPYRKQYVLMVEDEVVKPLETNCGNIIQKTTGVPYMYIVNINNLLGDFILNYEVLNGAVNISANYDGDNYEAENVTTSGNITIPRDNLDVSKIYVTVTPVDGEATFKISNVCPVGIPLKITSIVLADEKDLGKTMVNRFRWGSSSFFSENHLFEVSEISKFETLDGLEGVSRFPERGSTINIQAYKGGTNTGKFNVERENKLGYLITDQEYTADDIETILAEATYPEIQSTQQTLSTFLDQSNFVFNRPNNENLYLIWDYRDTIVEINIDTKIIIYFDNSGSMDSTLAPLQEMVSTILKDRLLPLYNNDETLYDTSVNIKTSSTERTLQFLNINGDTPEGNVVVLLFQDESNPIYHDTSFDPSEPRTTQYDIDLLAFRNRLSSFTPAYYRSVVFQVEEASGTNFKQFIQAVQSGTGNYSGSNGLSDRTEINYKYDIVDGGTPQYYLDKIVEALTELGYSL